MVPFHCLVPTNLVSYKDYYKYCFLLSHLQILPCISFHKLTSQITLTCISKIKPFKKSCMVTHLLGATCIVLILLLCILFKKRSVHIFGRVPTAAILSNEMCCIQDNSEKLTRQLLVGNVHMCGNEYVLDVP